MLTYTIKKQAAKAVALSLLAASCLWASCGNEEKADVDFSEFEVSMSAPLDKAPDAPACKIDMTVAYASADDSVGIKINKQIAAMLFDMQGLSLRQAADSFASSYTHDYVDYLTPFYKVDRSDPSKRPWYEYWYKLGTEVRHEKAGTVAYIATREYFEGGAHSIKTQTVTNFDCSTGNAIRLADVFVPGYERQLTDLLLQALKEKAGAADIDALRDKGYLCSSDMYVSTNFILGNDAITFVYNIYEIAPYETGTTELTIGYDDIDNLLKK